MIRARLWRGGGEAGPTGPQKACAILVFCESMLSKFVILSGKFMQDSPVALADKDQ